jgi:ribosomal subunit interface protein
MTLPTIKYKATNTELQNHLMNLVEEKFTTLDKYIGEETDVSLEVEFKKEAPHQNGDVYRFEANLWLRGKLYRADAVESNFEKAIAHVRDGLDTELLRHHKKSESLVRRGGRKIKEILRFGK